MNSFFIKCFLLFVISFPVVSSNSLINHASPYINLHANDKVNWRLWDESILEQAQQEDKLLFISIGYFACHWCHVMRDESFNDSVIADFINKKFIPVKVDRELNPVLDDYLMRFLQKTKGYGGWPLNVFVTPQGYPLTGLVYLPPDKFDGFIKNVESQWKSDQKKLMRLAKEAFLYDQQENQKLIAFPDNEKLLKSFLNHVKFTADDLMGGLGQQTKFPRPTVMLSLLEIYPKQSEQWLKEFLLTTLNNMMSKGLHDVIGGGFFRYTTDPNWQIPHYEKMLYTNAGLMLVYIRAYEIFEDARYLNVAMETADYLIREMKLEQGGFISSLSAQDEKGVEGAAYLWRLDELKHLLTKKEWEKLEKHWQFFSTENDALVLPVGMAFGNEWEGVRNKLRIKREKHAAERDNKFLMSWNGYALTAFSKLIKITNNKTYFNAAEQLYGLLLASAEKGMYRIDGKLKSRFLEDYALVAQGFLDWSVVANDSSSAKHAENITIKALELFVSGQGWRSVDRQVLPMPSDEMNIQDQQLPSPSAVLLNLIQRLQLQNHDRVQQKFHLLQKHMSRRMKDNPLSYAARIQYQLKYAK